MRDETEQRVKACLAEGLSNKEISDRIHVSVRMVKWHIGHLLRQRGLYGIADARRLIVCLVQEKIFALTGSAAPPSVSTVPEKPNHAHDAAQL